MSVDNATALKLKLVEKNSVADGVVELTFGPANGRALSTWTPGSHVEIHLPSGLRRQYSLCGSQTASDKYTVAVLRESEGRGGSLEVHEALDVGDVVSSSEPRNQFPLVDAEEYVLLAGGIGVTPVKAMLEELDFRGAPWRLIYCGRTRSTMAYADELLRKYGRERVTLMPKDETGPLDLSALVGSMSSNSVMYCCGPSRMLTAATEEFEKAGIPDKLHIEHFDAGGEEVSTDGDSFDVELNSTGETIRVEENQSILDALRAVRSDVPSSCEEGYCGTCETTVLAGQPDHRGIIMSPEEHDEEGTMLLCVSRAKCSKLVLDL